MITFEVWSEGLAPLPTGYGWHGDAPLASVDSDGFRPAP